ncbi:MAG: hypothetical protein Kapaf2KO_21820 [Candidatus Kapaibacteriales bacterium]
MVRGWLSGSDLGVVGFYAIFYGILFSVFYGLNIRVKNWKQAFFLIAAFAFLILNQYFKTYVYDIFQYLELNGSLYTFFKKFFLNFSKCLFLTLPLLFIYPIQKEKLNTFYGFSKKGFDAKPYLIMLLLMVPLIYFASQSSSFLAKYPRYVPGMAEKNGLISSTMSVALFETTYFLRFVGVEAFFRGLLAIGGVLLFGRKAILPAACIYSAWHFGKPMGEAIGAFFGGYILGVLAYKTESILGGIFIHYGVALLMELFAWLVILEYL